MSSNLSRRAILRNIAASVTMGGLTADAAQHVHEHAAAQTKKTAGVYKPKLFNDREFKTVARLSEIIIPADEVSGSALDAGAPAFIDIIANHNEDLATTIVGGLSWLDRQMHRRYGKVFLDAEPAQQLAMLDLIAYSKKATPDMAIGVRFFDWMRRLSADAFYTSPIGVKDVGYLGNKGMRTFQVPAAALEYAVKRSGL